MKHLLLVAIVAAIITVVTLSSAFGQSPPQIVEITISAAEIPSEALHRSVVEQLSAVPVSLRWSRSIAIDPREVLAGRPRDSQVVARVWVDSSDPASVRLYIADEPGSRYLVRSVPRGNESDEVAREALGHIIASAIDALQSGAQIGIERGAAEREIVALATPSVTASEPPESVIPAVNLAPIVHDSPIGIRIGVLYGLSMWGPQQPSHGPGIYVNVPLRMSARVSFVPWLTAQYLLPMLWHGDPAGARFEGGSLRLGASLEYSLIRQLRFHIGLGGGVDFLDVQPESEAWTAMALPPSLQVLPMLRGIGGLNLSPTRFLSIGLLVGFDVDLSGSHFDLIVDQGMTTVLFAPWVVRPLAMFCVGVSWN